MPGTGTRLNPRAIYADFSSLSQACCACITKLHVGLLKLHSIADRVVHKFVIATIKPCTHAAFGFMLLAVAYFVSFQTVTGGCAPRYRAIGLCIYA